MKNTRARLFGAGVLVCLVLAGCDNSTPEPVISTTTPVPTAAPDIYVSADGSGDYATLEEAIAAAAEGEEIRLGAGTFRLESPLDISTPLQLVGVGLAETEIVSAAAGYVVKFSGDGPYVIMGIGFRHEGGEVADVVVVDGAEVTFEGCLFVGAVRSEGEDRAGLRLQGDTTGTVQDCRATGNGNTGILVGGRAEPTVKETYCSGNELAGIGVIDQAQPRLEGNVCTSNVAGIAYRNRAGGVAELNTCSGNRWGLLVTDQAAPTLIGNTCDGNQDTGIAYYGGGGEARGNSCANNQVGIGVAGQANPTLEANMCVENTAAGISYLENGGGIARGNECYRNLVGIFVDELAVPELIDNILGDNHQDDIVDLR